MESLNYYPPMYDDEDIRSIVYRYKVLNGKKIRVGTTNVKLFNRDSNIISAFPSNLNYLVMRLRGASDKTLDELLSKHTYLPLLRHFMQHSKFVDLERYVQYGDWEKRKGIVNQGTTGFLVQHIKYCPSCLHDDEKRYGEAYIHRCHQVAYIDTCHIHREKLISRCPSCDTEFSVVDQLWKPVCNACKAEIKSQPNLVTVESIELAEDLHFLLHSTAKNEIDFKNRLLLFGLGKGYINRNGGHYNNKLIIDGLSQIVEKFGYNNNDIVELKDPKHLAYNYLHSGNTVRVFFQCF